MVTIHNLVRRSFCMIQSFTEGKRWSVGEVTVTIPSVIPKSSFSMSSIIGKATVSPSVGSWGLSLTSSSSSSSSSTSLYWSVVELCDPLAEEVVDGLWEPACSKWNRKDVYNLKDYIYPQIRGSEYVMFAIYVCTCTAYACVIVYLMHTYMYVHVCMYVHVHVW